MKAMTEVVLPAIDPANELAIQQAQLVLGHLMLLDQRLPLQYRADRDELARLAELGDHLRSRFGLEGAELQGALADAKDVLDRARAEPAELVTTIRALTAALDAPIQNAMEFGEEDVRRGVQSAVLHASEQQLLRDRAWLIMQGWEPDPAAVPDIVSLLPPVHAEA